MIDRHSGQFGFTIVFKLKWRFLLPSLQKLKLTDTKLQCDFYYAFCIRIWQKIAILSIQQLTVYRNRSSDRLILFILSGLNCFRSQKSFQIPKCNDQKLSITEICEKYLNIIVWMLLRQTKFFFFSWYFIIFIWRPIPWWSHIWTMEDKKERKKGEKKKTK